VTGAATKAELRTLLLAARREVPDAVRGAEARSLARHAAALADGLSGAVCAYLPIGTEPGADPALPTRLVDALVTAGVDVLLPVVPERPGALDWARYSGPDDVAPGPLGLSQPTGSRLGPSAVSRAGLVLVPALAVDRRGIRLGRGRGYYDRTLPGVRPGAQVVAVVRDEELVERLPADRHDVPVSAALTPGQGRLALPR
jgi:5-formyltetrahydrofolate cyclo-ligase